MMSYPDFYDDTDFYTEASEFDRQVDEFKESLMKGVKAEFIEEMESLRKENAELQSVKSNLKSIKEDYERKERDLNVKKQNLESQVRRERLSKLMDSIKIMAYTVGYSSQKLLEKCDKCDENRRIYYKTPLGNDNYEKCDCDKSVYQYKPVKVPLITMNLKSNSEIRVWYQVKYEDTRDEYLNYYEDSINGDKMIRSLEEFNIEESPYGKLFETKELCQEVCNLVNQKKLNMKIRSYKDDFDEEE